MNKTAKQITLGLLIGLACQVAMGATTWGFTSSSGTESGVVNGYGNSRQWVSGGVTVTATAWSNTVGTGNTAIEEAYVGWYSGNGLGVQNKDCSGTNCKAGANTSGTLDYTEGTSPEHSMDGETRFDSILFTFSEAVSLSQFSVGWLQNDSDVLVMAYTASSGGPADVNSILKGKTYSTLVSNGWTLTGTSSNTSLNTNKSANNVASASSMYWLVSVGNSAIWAPDSTTDYVKIASLVGDKSPPPPKVPEPASAALFGIALAGLAVSRRKVRS